MIIFTRMEHVVFLDSLSFLPCALRKLFGLEATISWYSHCFNTDEILDYVGPMHNISCYGVDEMIGGERNQFLAWYERQKYEPIDNRRVLLSYCQDDLTVLS